MNGKWLRIRWNEFQSHAGSIEASLAGKPPRPLAGFQSHAGSIEAREPAVGGALRIAVSIPRWFD